MRMYTRTIYRGIQKTLKTSRKDIYPWKFPVFPWMLSSSSVGTDAKAEIPKNGTENAQKQAGPRPFSEIPGPKVYPLIGTMPFLNYVRSAIWGTEFTRIVPFFSERSMKYSPLYKERMVGFDVVMLTSTEAIEAFFRKEEKYPTRFTIPMWSDYQEVSGEQSGAFTGQGEQWHRMRSAIDKPLLRLKDAKGYTSEINEVVTDMLNRLEKIRQDDFVIPDLEQEFFNWSLESAGSVLYEKRFGGLSDQRDSEMQAFISSVGKMFLLSTELFMYPLPFVKIFRNKKYKEHKAAWDVLFKTAKKCVNDRMIEIKRQTDKGEEVHGLLVYLLAQDTLSMDEVYSNITELMMAAVDTTSNTMLWCLYEISQRPDVQEKIFAEVQECLGDREIPYHEDLHNMPYMKAVIKETLRLYPSAGSISRITDNATEVCGYEIPAKTAVSVPLFAMSRLPKYFENPNDFVPERWLKDRADRPNPFANLAFGIGTRMCVGRRLAELEMYLHLSRLVRKYRVEPAFSEPALIALKLVLKPDRPIKIKLINRENK